MRLRQVAQLQASLQVILEAIGREYVMYCITEERVPKQESLNA